MKKDMFLKRKGQSLLETALVMPIMVLLVVGIIDFGILFNNYLIVSNASREGARKAAVGADNTAISASVLNAASTLDEAKLKLTIAPINLGDRISGSEVSVTLTYEHSIFTPIISSIIPNPIELTSISTMRME